MPNPTWKYMHKFMNWIQHLYRHEISIDIYDFVILILILYCTKIYLYIWITKITLSCIWITKITKIYLSTLFELFLLREKHKKKKFKLDLYLCFYCCFCSKLEHWWFELKYNPF